MGVRFSPNNALLFGFFLAQTHPLVSIDAGFKNKYTLHNGVIAISPDALL